MEFIVNEKQGPHGLLVIITDPDIFGKYYEEGILQLDLQKDFYKGAEKNKKDTKILIEKAQHIHFTGKNSVALGVELNLIDADKILWVADIPHAEVVIG